MVDVRRRLRRAQIHAARDHGVFTNLHRRRFSTLGRSRSRSTLGSL
jgi:hypothetical protein